MTRHADTLTRPADEAAAALAATPTADLLTKAYELTHRIHEHDASTSQGYLGYSLSTKQWKAQRAEQVASLRAMRDLITAEVLRRTGDA